MKRKTLFNLLPVLSLALALIALLANLPGIVGAQELGPQAAMGTAFTYQGRLTDGDEPANGTYDFRFIAYSAALGGSQAGDIVTKEDVTVTDGFFTVELDCGGGVFTGQARYLEIGVRPGEGTGDFTILSPRQPLLPAPYAFHASSATSLNAADGDPQEALYLDNEGNVGIGTTSPGTALDVNGPFIRTIARATGLGPNDGTDSGQIASRVLSFTKAKADTGIRVSYTDNLRAVRGGGGACRWEIRVDDASCPGGALFYDYYEYIVDGGPTHRSNTVVGYCEGLGAGTFEIQVWVGSHPGYPGSDCYTGWDSSRWVLEAEEVY